VTYKVQKIYIHPVKGLTPQEATHADLVAGHGISGDRAFGLLFCDTQPGEFSRHMPPQDKKFLATQNDWPALAALAVHVDLHSGEMIVKSDNKILLIASTKSETDLLRIDEFFSKYLLDKTPARAANHPKPGPLKMVGALGTASRFPDRSKYNISILNLASLRELERIAGAVVDIRRFRGNIIVDTGKPWEEYEWLGKTAMLGSSEIAIDGKIGRCSNINVHPDEGVLDLNLLVNLAKAPIKGAFGVLANIRSTGAVATESAGSDCVLSIN